MFRNSRVKIFPKVQFYSFFRIFRSYIFIIVRALEHWLLKDFSKIFQFYIVLTYYDGFLGYKVTPKAKNIVFGQTSSSKRTRWQISKDSKFKRSLPIQNKSLFSSLPQQPLTFRRLNIKILGIIWFHTFPGFMNTEFHKVCISDIPIWIS